MLEGEWEPELMGARMSRVGEQVEAQVMGMQDAMLGGRGPGWLWPGPGASKPGRQDPGLGVGEGGRAGLEEPEEEGDLLDRPDGREDREAVKSNHWVSTQSSWGQSSSSPLQYTFLANPSYRRN